MFVLHESLWHHHSHQVNYLPRQYKIPPPGHSGNLALRSPNRLQKHVYYCKGGVASRSESLNLNPDFTDT